MHNEFTAIFERDGEWVVAYCPEIPGANGQGRTKDEARESLRQAIALTFSRIAASMAFARCRPPLNAKR